MPKARRSQMSFSWGSAAQKAAQLKAARASAEKRRVHRAASGPISKGDRQALKEVTSGGRAQGRLPLAEAAQLAKTHRFTADNSHPDNKAAYRAAGRLSKELKAKGDANAPTADRIYSTAKKLHAHANGGLHDPRKSAGPSAAEKVAAKTTVKVAPKPAATPKAHSGDAIIDSKIKGGAGLTKADIQGASMHGLQRAMQKAPITKAERSFVDEAVQQRLQNMRMGELAALHEDPKTNNIMKALIQKELTRRGTAGNPTNSSPGIVHDLGKKTMSPAEVHKAMGTGKYSNQRARGFSQNARGVGMAKRGEAASSAPSAAASDGPQVRTHTAADRKVRDQLIKQASGSDITYSAKPNGRSAKIGRTTWHEVQAKGKDGKTWTYWLAKDQGSFKGSHMDRMPKGSLDLPKARVRAR